MPQTLSEGPYRGRDGRTYHVAADGRFLMVSSVTAADARPPEINVVIDWFQELTERVPTSVSR